MIIATAIRAEQNINVILDFIMKPRSERILVLIVGWSFILLGIAGLILPILQGLLFILIGLIILSSQYSWAKRLLAQLRARFPRIGGAADAAAARAAIWLKRLSRRSDPG